MAAGPDKCLHMLSADIRPNYAIHEMNPVAPVGLWPGHVKQFRYVRLFFVGAARLHAEIKTFPAERTRQTCPLTFKLFSRHHVAFAVFLYDLKFPGHHVAAM